uniref:Energy-coupling factor transporter transmembrane protein EcfT n=1 Tax=Geoglobus ahangari TaxID=113653 RepID=A0A7C4W3Q8_9EURY
MIGRLQAALREGDLEGRSSLISVFLLSLSVYISGFSLVICSLALMITVYFTKGRSLKTVTAFAPFYVLIMISGFFFDIGYAIKVTIAFATLLSVGTLIYSSKIEEIAGALIFFRFPKKLVSTIQLAVSIFPLLVNDLKEISEVIDARGLEYYKKILKAFVSTSILRALSISEALFSKNFNYNPIYEIRSPKRKDITLLLLSLLLFLSTVPLNLLDLHSSDIYPPFFQ